MQNIITFNTVVSDHDNEQKIKPVPDTDHVLIIFIGRVTILIFNLCLIIQKF